MEYLVVINSFSKMIIWEKDKNRTVMESGVKFNEKALLKIAGRCYDLLQSAPSKKDALRKISITATREFGDYFGPIILQDPNEISVNFIELLDQIVFEMDENHSGEDNIREYIIDDLYARINIYLEIFKDIDLYKQGLSKRIFCADDTIIIRHFKMREYIPDILKEFQEQPNLQKPILKCLLTFQADDLLNFYYQIAQGIYCIEIKSLALIGLKGFNSKFTNWHKLKTSDDELASLISYIESFEPADIHTNALPYDLNTLFFVINFIEQHRTGIINNKTVYWIYSVFKTFLHINIENSFFTSIFASVSNILISMESEYIKRFAEREEELISFIYFLDILPRSIFDRITVKLDALEKDFIQKVNEIISAGKITLDEVNSNTISYLLWNSPRSF